MAPPTIAPMGVLESLPPVLLWSVVSVVAGELGVVEEVFVGVFFDALVTGAGLDVEEMVAAELVCALSLVVSRLPGVVGFATVEIDVVVDVGIGSTVVPCAGVDDAAGGGRSTDTPACSQIEPR